MKIIEKFKEEYEKYVEINSKDGYSKAVIDCGETFGNLIDEGRSFDEAEKMMLETAEGSELTGYMMGAIMAAVAHFHPRGEEVKAWWNKQYGGTGEEKGTINPAILSIEK